MAPHDRLKLWQKILLGIILFPLLPIYLCVYYLYLKDKRSEEDGHGQGLDQVRDAEEPHRNKNINVSINKEKQNNGFTALHAELITTTPLGFSLLKDLKDKSSEEDGHGQGLDQVRDAEEPYRNKNRNVSSNKVQVIDETIDKNRGEPEDKFDSAFCYPWDRLNLKSLQMDLNAFKELDAYASKVKANGTVELLVRDLNRNSRTDLQKIRAIWIWICHHIAYDTAVLRNEALISTDPDYILRTRKGACSGYSALFESMCRFAGVNCKTVSGYSKGGSYKVGQAFSGDSTHAWNMVYLEKAWHLLDSTWGAGNVENGKFTFQYNEFYFLTNPALFIEDHFPEKNECQLLVPHVSLEQFEQNVRHRSGFYNFGLFSHPETAVIETVNGKVSLNIGTRHPVKFSFHLNRTEEPGLMTLKEHEMKLDVFPRKTGQHILEIFAQTQDSDVSYMCVLEHKIICKAVDVNIKIPKCLRQPVGPSWLSLKAGLLQPSQPNPVIHTEDGCCTISFTVEQGLSLFSDLRSDEIQIAQDMKSRHIFQKQEENKVVFKIRLPQSGAYVLCVNVKLKNSDSYISPCTYLITCTNTAVKWPMFPLTYENWAAHYELVEPLDGFLPENSQIPFKLQIPGVIKVAVGGKSSFPLTLSANGYWEGTYSTANTKEIFVMVMYKDQPNTWSYILQYQVGKKY
ncbi:kyphoscoliosis peptidase-like [Discoglossus pictus]